jgi:hypothetical protein
MGRIYTHYPTMILFQTPFLVAQHFWIAQGAGKRPVFYLTGGMPHIHVYIFIHVETLLTHEKMGWNDLKRYEGESPVALVYIDSDVSRNHDDYHILKPLLDACP